MSEAILWNRFSSNTKKGESKMKRIFGCFIISVFLFAGTASAELKGGHGWSVNPDHELALEEAVSMMEKKVKAPFMIHVYYRGI